MRHDLVALVWLPHEARTEAFAKWLNASLYNVHYLQARRPLTAPIRYVLQWVRTWQILLRDRPRLIFVTNSPPVAGLCVLSYCVLARAEYVLDTHPPSLFGRKWRWARPFQRFTAKRARVNLVDQDRFKTLLDSWGARTLVLGNPPKTIVLPTGSESRATRAPVFTYVGTFGGDEPVDILLEAAGRLPHVTFAVLGERRLAKRRWLESAPANVVFTGYLTKDAYWQQLALSVGVIVMTTHAHSLLGGAQDGLYLGRPLLLSDQPTLREHFTKGTLFFDNTADALTESIAQAMREQSRLEREIVELRDTRSRLWQEAFEQLQEIVRTSLSTPAVGTGS